MDHALAADHAAGDGQQRRPLHQVLVNVPGGHAPLIDRPDHQRLATAAI